MQIGRPALLNRHRTRPRLWLPCTPLLETKASWISQCSGQVQPPGPEWWPNNVGLGGGGRGGGGGGGWECL